MDSALDVSGLTVVYPGHRYPAAEDVTFSVPTGSITMLIGPNGSGKTTVLRSILGLVPHRGTVRIFGNPLSHSFHEIGYVPQRFSFDRTFPITVHEFLWLSLSAYVNETALREQYLHEALEAVEAEDLRSQQLSTLSGGQLQRVLLARALAHQPRLLLLDEPEAGVDVAGEQTFYDLLQSLTQSQRLTALIASHELDVVYAYADQVICINRRLFCSGVPKHVLNQDMFVELYGRDLKFYGHEH